MDLEQSFTVANCDKFDYTEWRRAYFDSMTPEEINHKAIEFENAHPFTGNAVRV